MKTKLQVFILISVSRITQLNERVFTKAFKTSTGYTHGHMCSVSPRNGLSASVLCGCLDPHVVLWSSGLQQHCGEETRWGKVKPAGLSLPSMQTD